jgi:hypothetical protein
MPPLLGRVHPGAEGASSAARQLAKRVGEYELGSLPLYSICLIVGHSDQEPIRHEEAQIILTGNLATMFAQRPSFWWP